MKNFCTVLIGMLLCLISKSYAYDIEVDGFYYNITSAQDLTLSVTHGDKSYRDSIIIPKNVIYKSRTFTVTEIGRGAFSNCRELTYVELPNSIVKINEYAFNGCRKLLDISISESVTHIEESAFEDCFLLNRFTIGKNVVYIGNDVFRDCKSLKELIIEDGSEVLTLGYNYEGINYSGSGLFNYCPIDSLYLGRNLKYEDKYMSGYTPFYNNDNIRIVTIGDFISSVEGWYFNQCDNLTTITYGKNVVELGALNFCEKLSNIYMRCVNPPTVVQGNFSNKHYTDVVLYVPEGTLSAYQLAEEWKNFWDIREYKTTSINDVWDTTAIEFEFATNGFKIKNINGGKLAVYSSNGSVSKSIQNYCGETIVLDKGVYIVNLNGQSVKVVF